MAYCSAQDVINRYGSKVSTWAENDQEKIESACADASSEVDGYLVLSGATVPLSPVPAYMVSYVVDMAAYLLLLRTGFLSGSEGEEELGKRASAARSFFEKWAEGKFDAGNKDGVTPGTDPARPRVRNRTEPRLNLLGYW